MWTLTTDCPLPGQVETGTHAWAVSPAVSGEGGPPRPGAQMSSQPRSSPLIGYHASHEQLPPSELLGCVVAAEAAGFQAAMCSDHFAPWSSRQGHSGFAWSWLGAALQATGLDFGVVNAPGQRYHPAIIAQAAAT